jgi:AraC-like DNA-binding protein
LGQAAELAANGANLREALRLRSQYLALCSNAFALKLRENRLGAQLILQFDPQTTPPQQLSDYLAANILGWIRAVLREKNWSPLRTDFEHREPKRLKIFKAEFGENLRFGSNATRFLLDHGSLDRTIPGADSQRIKRLRARADAKLQALATAQRIARSAEDKIVELLPNGWASTGDVAAALRISSRTLQRSLTSEGLSFRELLETARISRAEHLLTKTNLPLTEIAFQLGYAELSAFSRAAKMWFGVPPQSLRKRGR